MWTCKSCLPDFAMRCLASTVWLLSLENRQGHGRGEEKLGRRTGGLVGGRQTWQTLLHNKNKPSSLITALRYLLSWFVWLTRATFPPLCCSVFFVLVLFFSFFFFGPAPVYLFIYFGARCSSLPTPYGCRSNNVKHFALASFCNLQFPNVRPVESWSDNGHALPPVVFVPPYLPSINATAGVSCNNTCTSELPAWERQRERRGSRESRRGSRGWRLRLERKRRTRGGEGEKKTIKNCGGMPWWACVGSAMWASHVS